MKVFMALAAAFLLAACGGSRIVREPPAPLVDFVPEARVNALWVTDIGAGADKEFVKLSPFIDGGAVYAADTRGKVSAMEADTGKRKWSTDVEKHVTGAVGGGEGLVVVATRKGEVVALGEADGKRVWIANVSSEVLAPPAVRDGVVVVQTVDGKLYGLSAKSGERLWVYTRSEPALSLRGTSAPIIFADGVLTGFASGKIVAVQLKNGRLLWEHTVAEPHGRNEIERLVDVDISPLVAGDKLFAASYQGRIVAINLRTGAIVWSRDISTYSGMSADRSNIYVTDENGYVIALDQRTGASVWKQDKLRGRGLNAPTVVDGNIAVGDFEGYVHWLSRDDGHFIARYRLGGGAIRAKGLARDDTLYIASQGAELGAMRLVKK